MIQMVWTSGLLLLLYRGRYWWLPRYSIFSPLKERGKPFAKSKGCYKRFDIRIELHWSKGYHAHQFSDGKSGSRTRFLDHSINAGTAWASPAKELAGKATAMH